MEHTLQSLEVLKQRWSDLEITSATLATESMIIAQEAECEAVRATAQRSVEFAVEMYKKGLGMYVCY